jgi:hypothetical protein
MVAKTHTFPPEVLAQHIAALGKTGSGKTSTAKLIVEQVVADGARVCILDPIKSDWWGLISSADGKKPGLSFHVLGGPRGHVPLHASAGKAIGEIVANGSLPLSIVDMADFEPGGQAKFFVDFAPTLLRKMRGVVYLVIEEAHLFAPKERSGIGAENLSIHWAKMLATAGRSKGIRLIVVTQRTQALHNALLGSCDTMLAHRLTAPADQEPVVAWLKANTSKDVMQQVASSLSSLKTGDAWLCSGEAKRFEVVHFPRIQTYDNTATPTGDGHVREVKTAAVDQDKLRSIIGVAVEEAKANDPKALKAKVDTLTREIEQLRKKPVATAVPPAPAKTKTVEILTDADRARLDQLSEQLKGTKQAGSFVVEAVEAFKVEAARAVAEVIDGLHGEVERSVASILKRVDASKLQQTIDKLERVTLIYRAGNPPHVITAQAPARPGFTPTARSTSGLVSTATARTSPLPPLTRAAGRDASGMAVSSNPVDDASPAQTRMLDALRRSGGVLARRSLAIRSGYSMSGGGFRTTLSGLRGLGLIYDAVGDAIAASDAASDFGGEPMTAAEIREIWRRKLSPAAWNMLAALIDAGAAGLERADLATACNYEMSGGGFRTTLSALSSSDLIDKQDGRILAATEFL